MVENISDATNHADSRETLQKAYAYGILDLDALEVQIEMQERKKYLEMHSYKISHGKGVDNRWYTQLGGKRVVRKNLKDLENLIIAYYKEKEVNPTVDDVFHEWISYKMEYDGLSKQSYDRYMTDYKRFFFNDLFPLAGRKIKHIDECDIEDFIKLNVKKLNLTQKAHSGLRTIINGIFKFAKRKKYTNLSISLVMGDIEMSRNAFKVVKKDRREQVFLESEIHQLIEYVSNNPDIFNLAIHLDFLTGLRVGELSALKYSDLYREVIEVKNKDTGEVKKEVIYKLAIQRTEIKIKDRNNKNTFPVQEKTKTDAGMRDIIITEEAVNIIEAAHSMNPDGEYLFMNNGTRIRGNRFTRRLEVICRKLQINEKSMHKVRKTYGSVLWSNGTDETLVTEQMGHTSISTTKQSYIFNFRDSSTEKSQINEAIKNIC